MSEIILTPEKEGHIKKLAKAFKELDSAMLPFREQRKELQASYVENSWLSKEEVVMVKKAYNALKNKLDLDDLSTFVDLLKKEMIV